MPTSSYMPDVQVQVAFDSGYSTPAASRTWTDVSAYVELEQGIDISWGRSDERSSADANQLRLTLDNSDGRFTAGDSSSPYYPNVKLNRPIRVLADSVDGGIETLFMGYVNEWPVEWNGTDAYAYATISASSRLSRLGLQSQMRSIISAEILADDPIFYATLGEPEGATSAADSSGNGGSPMTMTGGGTDVVFGQATGPGTDGLTAATFTSAGKALGVSMPVETYGGGVTIDGYFLSSTPPAATTFVMGGDDNTSSYGYTGIGVDSSGQVVGLVGGTVYPSATNICDGLTHHLALTADGTTERLYVDGVEVDNSATAGQDIGSPFAGGPTGADMAMVLAHLAIYSSALSATRIAAHAAAGSTGHAGDTTDARLERYATFAGIPTAEVDAEAGTTTMQHVDTTDRAPVEMMRVAETTEGGVLFDERDGTLTLHNRAHRYAATSLFTLNMTEHEVEADFAPVYDRTGLANLVTVADTSGVWSATVKDDTSIDDHFEATVSGETASQDDDEPLNMASWLVYANKDPRTRVPTLSVMAVAQVGKTPNCAAVLAATVGDKITVSNQPSQMAVTSSDYFIEGGTFSIGPESVRVTWNVSPSAPWDQTLIVSDATRGVVGTYAVSF